MSYTPFSSIFAINYQVIAGTPYVVQPTDYIIGVLNESPGSNGVTIQLPDTPVDGKVFIIFDAQGNISNTNPIIITTVSGVSSGVFVGDTSNGAASSNLVNPYGSMTIISSASGTVGVYGYYTL